MQDRSTARPQLTTDNLDSGSDTEVDSQGSGKNTNDNDDDPPAATASILQTTNAANSSDTADN